MRTQLRSSKFEVRSSRSLALVAIIVSISGLLVLRGSSVANDQSRGQEIIQKFVEVNRFWLSGPPTQVRSFSYVLNRVSGTQAFEIEDPMKTPRARLQGVTYSAMIHQLARSPKSATVREIVEEPGRLKLALSFEPAVRGACGNGVENSWNGYHSLGGKEGYLVLDTERWVPLEAEIGRLHETFGEFVKVDEQHYVPLAIRIQLEDTRYDWRFRVYEPGLWLFDESYSGDRRLAWVEKVRVDSSDARLAHATAASLERAESEKSGEARLQAFLKANRQWLLPSLQARRGVVYEYRQEDPYLERLIIDAEGNLFARLEGSKGTPSRPTRQRLWLADGRSYTGDANDQLVKFEGAANSTPEPDAWLARDRLAQHLAMGLALDCALTRLAREPDGFRVQVRPVSNRTDCYLLVLHPKRDARLFTGTMLIFSSSCYMHDVRYDRSEILCEAATHRPIEEKDYAGKDELKGHYRFEGWLDDSSGAAPRQIRAVLPYEKDGKDQALEMDAQFHFAKPGLWLLERVESHFRGGAGAATGTVSLVSANPDMLEPIRELVQKGAITEGIMGSIQQGPAGIAEREVRAGEWCPFPLRAAWAEKARSLARGEDKEVAKAAVIGVHRARISPTPEGKLQVELDGISTAAWKEFEINWRVDLRDDAGHLLGTASTNVIVRAEGGPSPFLVCLEVPRPPGTPDSASTRVTVEGTVKRMSGAYHGHGVWMHFSEKD